MLAYILALTVGLGSLAIYLAAFFFPEIHRKNDFIWSGVGLFYALVLWVFAGRITGGLLLGHVASVALLAWSVTQTLSLRRQLTPKIQQTPIPSTEAVTNTIQDKASSLSVPERIGQVQKGIGGMFSGVKDKAQQSLNKKTPQTTSAPTKAAVEVVDNRTPLPEQPATTTVPEEPAAVLTSDTESKIEPVPEAIPPHPPSPELVEAAKEAAAAEEAAIAELAKIPMEEMAPDAVLAPPAEEPIDTKGRTTVEETAAILTSDTESKIEPVPEAIPPHPPSPELVEAAKEAAAAEEAAIAELAKIPMEEMAPDAVLAPPAEEPIDTKEGTT